LAATSQTSLTVTAGQVANYAIAISPVNGFTAQVALSCSGAPQPATCLVNPGSVTVNSSGATANVVVTTSGSSARLTRPAGFPPAAGTQFALWLGVPGAFGLLLLGRRSPFRKRHAGLFYGLTACCLLSIGIISAGCSSSSSSSGGGTAPGTYNLMVTGTSTSGSTTLTNTTQLTLVVQ
jgi:hypothetical protein